MPGDPCANLTADRLNSRPPPRGQGMLEHCELCPRRCGANRLQGALGYCRAGSQTQVYRWGPHHGEEPPVSGTRGSGTVFFSRCTMRCLYCQNFPWSQEGKGAVLTVQALAGVFEELRGAGCHNWNLVSPTPWLPLIRAALSELDTRLPIVYNTSGFERVEVLDAFADLADVYLTDLRYADEQTALAGSGAPGYVEAARNALRAMWRRRGPLVLDDEGVARSGTICRLLVLPGLAGEAVANLRWIAENLGTELAVSVMAQYVPAYRAPEHGGGWERRVTAEEYDAVSRAVEELGFSNGWVQEFDAAIPAELVGYRMAPGQPA